jgi:MFS family permease
VTDPSAASGPEPRSGVRLLLDRNFGPYLAGNALSGIGTWFQNLAASLLIYELTRSTLMVGVVNFAQFVGALVLAPVAGSAADRFDRRHVLMVSQAVAAVVSGGLAVLTLAGEVTAPLLVLSTALLGLALAFFAPSMLSMVPLLVPRDDLDTALSINSASFNLARAVGPVLAAGVIDQFGYGPAFAINATTFAIFVGLLATVRPRASDRADPGSRPRLRDAVGLVRRTDVVVPLLVVVAVCSIAIDPVYTLTPELAIDVFGGTEQTTGLLVGAFGTGAVLTAMFVVSRLKAVPYILGISLTTMAVGMGLVAVAPRLWVALVGLAVTGAGYLASLTRATTRIQNAVPDAQLGRVMALWSVCFIGTRPFVAIVDGAVADLVHPRVAAGMLAVVPLVTAWWIRSIVRPRVEAARERRRTTRVQPESGAVAWSDEAE